MDGRTPNALNVSACPNSCTRTLRKTATIHRTRVRTGRPQPSRNARSQNPGSTSTGIWNSRKRSEPDMRHQPGMTEMPYVVPYVHAEDERVPHGPPGEAPRGSRGPGGPAAGGDHPGRD